MQSTHDVVVCIVVEANSSVSVLVAYLVGALAPASTIAAARAAYLNIPVTATVPSFMARLMRISTCGDEHGLYTGATNGMDDQGKHWADHRLGILESRLVLAGPVHSAESMLSANGFVHAEAACGVVSLFNTKW
jgi:hypothetical protein